VVEAKTLFVSLLSLADQPFVVFPHHLGTRLDEQIVGMFQQARFVPQVVQEAIQMQTIASLVAELSPRHLLRQYRLPVPFSAAWDGQQLQQRDILLTPRLCKEAIV
jgi:CTP:molybdopterin cytidylyltransferase MocA